ncbi:MAG: carboxypeptidase regulatory-like domain-containing protein, partial [Bacteroidetes bacterium]|nr:carboxypeptidase regulatory-like domain-containing protein [Bacteroidota bacterium]
MIKNKLDLIYCCRDCGNLICKRTALHGLGRCKVCSNLGEFNPVYGISKFGKGNSYYKQGLPRCLDCNKELTNYKSKRCAICFSKNRKDKPRGGKPRFGKKAPCYKDGRSIKDNFCIDCNKKLVSYKSERCYECWTKQNVGENNGNYVHGEGYAPYPIYFNNALKNIIKERDNFYYNVVSNSLNQIIIDVGDGLDNIIYDYPLTTDIVVPNNWGDVVFTQGNVTETLTPFTNNGINYVRADIIPDAGNVIIENSSALFIITSSTGANGSVTPLGVSSINSGSSQTYTITPNSGYNIESITVDGNPVSVTTPSGQSYTFSNVTTDHTISALFSSIVTNYTFSGKVTYNNSANSPLANVTLKLTSSNSTFEASTNSTGDFQFNNLIPGTYQIT